MNFQKNFSNKISFLLVVSILIINLSFLSVPKKVSADTLETTLSTIKDLIDIPAMIANSLLVVPSLAPINAAPFTSIMVTDPSGYLSNKEQDIWTQIGKFVADKAILLLKKAAKNLIIDVTNATVDWIGHLGDKTNSPPSYVTNFGSFMAGVGDRTVGSFIDSIPQIKNLCEPFRAQIQVALGISAGYGPGHLFDGSNCSLTQVVANVNNAANSALNSFTGSGGWDSWLSLTANPQNNVQGAYLILQGEMGQQVLLAQETKTVDLQNGQGALSFKSCYDTYEIGGTDPGRKSDPPYYDDTDFPPFPQDLRDRASSTGQMLTRKQHCDMKTPGTIITSQLAQSVNADKNMSEMVAALSDSIDAITSAVMDQLFSVAQSTLYNGVFDGKTTDARNAYKTVMNGSYTETLTALQNSYASGTVPTYCDDPFATNYNNNEYGDCTYPETVNQDTTPLGGTSPVYFNYVQGTSALARAQNQALVYMNLNVKYELAYQNTYKTAQNILTQAREEFASSTTCSARSGGRDSAIRIMIIRSNIITNIDGIPPETTRDIATVDFNLIAISNALKNSAEHMDLLSKGATDIQSAKSNAEVSSLLSQVQSTRYNTDPETELIPKIKTWLERVAANYDDPLGLLGLCPIDLTDVLQINSPATQ